MEKRQSRLQETAHSSFNLREAYISDTAEYIAALRDEALFSNWGVKVLIRIPVTDDFELNENNVDCYSNFVDVTWEDTTELVIPLFKEYRQNQSENGMTADGTDGLYPLEVLIPTKLHLPRNSRIIFSEYNSREERIAREWTVLGTQMKQLSDSKTYSRVANCVPSRQTTFDSLNAEYLGTIWFDWLVRESLKEKLRAHGIIWFYERFITKGGVVKLQTIDEIQEVPEYHIIYLESINQQQDYLNAPEYIIASHTGFKVGEEVPLYIEDEEGNRSPLMIAIDENNTTVQMQLRVQAVNNEGKVTKYALLPSQGYSKLSDTNELVVKGITQDNNQIIVKVTSVQTGPKELQETIMSEQRDETLKYIAPYAMETRFVAKKVAISVLNW